MKLFIFGSGDFVKRALLESPSYSSLQIHWAYHPEWDRVWSRSEYLSPDEVLKEPHKTCAIKSYNDLIKKVKKLSPDLALIVGSRWIFKPEFFNLFPKGVFNFHPGALPFYKGGGGFTWAILNGEDRVAGTIHEMVQEIDAGAIVMEDSVTVGRLAGVEDFQKAGLQLYAKLIKKFLVELDQNRLLAHRKQNDRESRYFPLLETNINGAIDWHWEGGEIESFIRAFGHPYAGAYTFVGDKKYKLHILESTFEPGQNLHPFTYGLVLASLDAEIRLSVREGMLRVPTDAIHFEDPKIRPEKLLREGARLWTPADIRDQALYHRPTNK